MKPIRTTVYEAVDGKQFTDPDECRSYEVELGIRKFVDKHGLGSGGCWSGSMIASSLLDNRQELNEILNGGFTP